MTELVAPQEDQLHLPDDWSPWLLPRRGKRTGEPPKLDPEGPKNVRVLTKVHDSDLRASLALAGNRAVADAALGHLNGEPDPVGAGVIAALLHSSERRRSTSVLRPDLDAWFLEHGLAFAVCASITRLGITSGTIHRPVKFGVANRLLESASVEGLGFLYNDIEGSLHLPRALLAGASEAEYEAALAGAAALRTGPAERFAATLFFPEQESWAAEVCGEWDSVHYAVNMLLWQTIERPEHLAAAGLEMIDYWQISSGMVSAIIDNLGAASLPILTATLRQQLGVDDREPVLDAIALLPSDEAMSYLLDHLAEPFVYAATRNAVARYPRRALRLLAARGGNSDLELRPRLAALAAAVPTDFHSGLASGDLVAIESLLAPSPIPVAAPETLPPLLTAPPWTVKRPKAKPVVQGGLASTDEPRIVWAEGEQERWSNPKHGYFIKLDDEGWRKYIARKDPRSAGRTHAVLLAYAPVEFTEEALAKWDGSIPPYGGDDMQVILTRFGTAVADRLVTALRGNSALHSALPPILSPDAARLAADWFSRLKSARVSAIAWFDRHGVEGARLLVPDALGSNKKDRRAAEGALGYLAARHGRETVLAAAEPYGEAAVAGIRSLLDGDPLEPRGVKVPKVGSWFEPEVLPPVLLKGRDQALPAESVRHLATVLALATPEYPYAGLDVVAETCDRDSLARFGRALFQLWLSYGAPSTDGWVLTQLAHFADDDTVRLLAPKIREWPGQNQHKRAVTGLGVLGAIGTEAALRAIQGIADKVKFKALKQEARVQIEAIAAGLGLSAEQLADRLVPDFGLGEASALVLDYGPRAFKVAFDEQLKPYVTDETGKPRKSLPKPGAKDDPEIAAASYQRFTLLKKELRTTAADQVARLESAMVKARTWTVEEFRRFFVDHPLVKHLSRRLVWQAETDGTRSSFRIAEDGSFSDTADDAVALPEGATIRLAHPIHMEPKESDTWAEILADYEILQPFQQLGRPVMAFSEEELATGLLTRFEAAEVEVGRILGLTKRGWQRAHPEDGGVEPGVYYPLPGGGYVTIGLEPGIWVGMIAENPVQTLRGVCLRNTPDFWWHGSPVPDHPKDIDPLIASEILTALDGLIAKD
jgi:hypothetical protein